MNNEIDLYSNLSDEEFCRVFAREYLSAIEQERDDNYEINRPQWVKMIQVLDYFYKLAQQNNGNIESCQLQPKYQHGGVTATFTVLDLQEKDIPEFCQAILQTNAITIDAVNNGKVCISLSIPYVFRKK